MKWSLFDDANQVILQEVEEKFGKMTKTSICTYCEVGIAEEAEYNGSLRYVCKLCASEFVDLEQYTHNIQSHKNKMKNIEHPIQIVLVTGKKRSGKSTLANQLELSNWIQFSFAAPIRKFVAELCDMTLEELEENKNTPLDILNGQTPRFAMQTLGTEWGRDTINPKLWTSLVRNKILKSIEYGNSQFVISDCRFDSEYYDIQEYFKGKNIDVEVLEVVKPDLEDDGHSNHISEAGLDEKIYRLVVNNSFNTVEEYLEMITDTIVPFLNDQYNAIV